MFTRQEIFKICKKKGIIIRKSNKNYILIGKTTEIYWNFKNLYALNHEFLHSLAKKNWIFHKIIDFAFLDLLILFIMKVPIQFGSIFSRKKGISI